MLFLSGCDDAKRKKLIIPFFWISKAPLMHFKLTLWVCLCLSLLGGCSWFFEEKHKDTIAEEPLDLPSLPYITQIVPKLGQEPLPEVDDHLKAASLLLKLETRPPTSLNALYQRIRSDVIRLKQALAEKGYFDGEVDYRVEEKKSPISVTLQYSPGARYKISKITVIAEEKSGKPIELKPSKAAKFIKLHPEEDIDLLPIKEANQRLAKYFRDHGYPFAEMDEPEGEIDRASKKLHIIFRAKLGKSSTYGPTSVIGLRNLDPQFVRNRVVWQEGESFEERELELTHRKLMGTGIFSGIEIKPNEEAKEKAIVPVTVKVTEGPPRTIGAGLKYATTEGIGGQAFWNHRNIFGGGEGLGVLLRLSPRLSKAKIDLDIPDIFAPDEHWRNEVSATREQNRAYTSHEFEIATHLEHPFSDTIKGLIGLTGEVGRVKRSGVNYVNRLIGLPAEVRIDTSNDLINPTKGGRLTLQVTPYVGKSGTDSRLMISSAKGTYYLRLIKGDAIILAGWAHSGTIAVSSLNNLAPNKRFYAGGVGSVRAYGYKLLGPLDVNRVPVGGRSILEYGLEGRFKASDSIGFVLFAEAGNVSAKASPDLSSKARLWGIGTGIRYYTSVGPIRFDVAIPMKRRHDGNPKAIDSPYQFYLSVGQAF